MILNAKRERGFWYYERIKRDYDLSNNQATLYSWLRRHCVNYNDNGYCGFSNERIASEVGVSLAQVKNDLRVLLDKELIVIKNAGKRTKKAGESREIYIAIEPHLIENQMEFNELRIIELTQRIEKLQEQLKQATTGLEPNAYVFRLYKGLGITSAEEINRLARNLNTTYDAFAVSWGYGEMMKHIEYMIVQAKKEKPDNLLAYLYTSLENYNKRLSWQSKGEAHDE